MMRRILAAVMVVGLLASCATRGQDSDSAAGGAAGGASGDQAIGSDPVLPVGGDLREGQPWFLVATAVDTVIVPPDVTLTFQAGRVSGRGPVNTFSATYTADADGSMELGPIGATKMAGPEERMTAESALFDLLGRVDGYTAVAGGELYLFDDRFQLLTLSVNPPEGDPAVPDSVAELAEEVVGMSEAEAGAAVKDAGCVLRIVERDGEAYMVTQDYRTDRVNVTIVAGVVTAASVG